MAGIKDAISKVTPAQPSQPPKPSEGPAASKEDDRSPAAPTPKYVLRVAAGPSKDPATHHFVPVNGDTAVAFENEHVRAKVKVRIRDFHGLPRASRPQSPYFDDPSRRNDRYSVAFAFVPKADIPALHTRWGNDFDHPVRDRLPPGFNTAFRIVKDFIDPGLACDAYADEPWLLGPSLSCWFAFRVGDEVGQDGDFPQPEERPPLQEGADGSGVAVRERLGVPDDAQKRRKFFINDDNRSRFVFEKGRVYQGDFHNPYLDFGNFAVKLPGFSIGVLRFIDDKSHVLRYVFKNVDTGDVYFVVTLTLLFGDELREALAAEDKTQVQASGGRDEDVDGGVD